MQLQAENKSRDEPRASSDCFPPLQSSAQGELSAGGFVDTAC